MAKNILVAVNDIFFAGRIQAVAEQLGLTLTFAKQADQVRDSARHQPPDLVIFDLNDPRCRPLETIRHLKGDPQLAGITIIGYLPHVQVELQQQAKQAGCDHVLPKSAFTRLLPVLLSELTGTASEAGVESVR